MGSSLGSNSQESFTLIHEEDEERSKATFTKKIN